MTDSDKRNRLPNPKWLIVAAIVLMLWAIVLGVWWSQLREAATQASAIYGARPTLATSKPGARLTTTPAPVATPLTVPVVRSPAEQVRQEDWLALARSFDEERALADIAELASAKYAGRAVGSPGGKQAAEWIAARFAEYGLQPAGDNGTYFQEFPVPYAELTAMPSFQLIDEGGKTQKEYHFRSDYTIWLGGYADKGQAEGPVLWLSDGKHEDYDAIDAQGAIVLCRYTSQVNEVLRQALEHGAKAVLLARLEETNFRLRRTAREDALLPQGIPTLLVGPQVIQDLLADSGLTLDDLTIQYQARPLATRVRLDVPLQYQENASGRNVLGVLPGSDPDGVSQVVIIGAHYDHLGADPDGTTWGGANDNASGVAVLLEIARQWEEQGYVPKRTVLFAAWDGEEIGLYGSTYYVEHPSYPLTSTVGMLALDMVGAGTSELLIDAGGLVADQAMISADQLGIPVRAQSMGRSDHAPFVAANVPATLFIWWDGYTPGVIYHVPEDNVENIEPAKLKAAGQLASLVMLNLSWEQEELEDLEAEREQAIASRDIAALLRTVAAQESLRQQEEAWLSALASRQPAEFTLTASPALIAGDIATSMLTIHYRWLADDKQTAVSFPSKWMRHDANWYYAGPAWDELDGNRVRIQHLQQLAQAETVAQQAETLYERLTDEVGFKLPETLSVRLYPSDSLARALEIPLSLVGQVDNLPYTDKAAGWPVNGGIVLSQPTAITTTLLEFALQRAGWPITASQWLAQGLSDHWRADDPAAAQEIEAEYVPLLLQADTDKTLWPATAMPSRYEVPVEKSKLWAAQAWAMTRYLLQTGGWPALQQPSLAYIEPWHTALLEPWHAALQGINATLAERSKAVLARDQAAFLATVDAANATLYQEEQHWFADLQIHPARTFVLEGQLLSLSGDQATVRLHMAYRLAEADSLLGTVIWRARFVQRDGRWLYADVDFDSAQSAHFVLKFMNAEQGSHAQELLAAAERAYAQVTSDLDFRPTQPIEIKLYDQDDLFRASIFLSMTPAHGWTEPRESLKLLNVEPASAGWIIAHELTHQALFAKGVQHDGVHEGTAQYEAGRYDPQWQNQQVRKWRQQVYDVVRGNRPINLATFDDWRQWQQDPGLIYNLSWDVVAYFRQRYGRETFLKWLDLLGSSTSFENAFLQATGISFADFDAAWRASVLRGHIAPQDIATAQAFSGERALQHVQTLAQPAWAGREAGSAGNDAAARYIAERFAEYGLQPAGERDSYFQTFLISQTTLITTPVLTLQSDDNKTLASLRYRVDFREVVRGYAGGGHVENAIVYVKNSLLDDQRLNGRVLLTEASANPAQDAQAAWEHGASALLLVTDIISRDMPSRSDYPLSPIAESAGTETVASIPTCLLTKEAFQTLLKLAGYSAAELANAPPALPLPLRATVDVQIAFTPTAGMANVLGVLNGGDPQLANEVLIVGAHLDHIGSLPDGTVYPGANDDASGIGVLLEIAHVWHERGYRPRRTVLFAAWNAEEQGLLGSAYYVAHPTHPLSQTRTMLQLDMVGQGRGYYIAVSGDEQQDALILAHLENAAGQVEGRLNFGKYEAASDHDSFHKQGVPAVWLSWERPEYRHLPQDSADTIDANKLRATGRVVTLALMTMADE